MVSVARNQTRASSREIAINGRSLRIAFYYIYIACLIGVNASLFVSRVSIGELASNQLFTASWIALHGAAMIVFLSLIGRQDSRNFTFVCALGAFILASAAWSVAPSVTLIYGGMLAGNILVAHLMASELSFSEIIRLVARVILVLSLVAVIAYYLKFSTVYYYDAHQRPNILGSQPFRGFTAHKILMGLYVTVGLASVLATMRGAARAFWIIILGLCVALTGSMIGIVIFAITPLLFFLIKKCALSGIRPWNMLLTGGALAAISAYFVYANWQNLLALLERDSTLTGRTTLWNLGVDAWLQRPLLGWGFGAYLQSANSDLTNRAFNRYGTWDIPHFHQSFIQTAVDLGAVGVVILVGILFYVLAASYKYALNTDAATGSFAFVTIAVLIMSGMVMFAYFNYNHLGTFLVMLLFFALRRESAISDRGPIVGATERVAMPADSQRLLDVRRRPARRSFSNLVEPRYPGYRLIPSGNAAKAKRAF